MTVKPNIYYFKLSPIGDTEAFQVKTNYDIKNSNKIYLMKISRHGVSIAKMTFSSLTEIVSTITLWIILTLSLISALFLTI